MTQRTRGVKDWRQIRKTGGLPRRRTMHHGARATGGQPLTRTDATELDEPEECDTPVMLDSRLV